MRGRGTCLDLPEPRPVTLETEVLNVLRSPRLRKSSFVPTPQSGHFDTQHQPCQPLVALSFAPFDGGTMSMFALRAPLGVRV